MRVYYHGNGSHGCRVFTVYLHNISKTSAARITKLDYKMVHHEVWKLIFLGPKGHRSRGTKNSASMGFCTPVSAGFFSFFKCTLWSAFPMSNMCSVLVSVFLVWHIWTLINNVTCGLHFPWLPSCRWPCCVRRLRERDDLMRTSVVSPLDAWRRASKCLAIDRAGTSVGRAATEVGESLEVGACRPGVEWLSYSDPLAEEARLQHVIPLNTSLTHFSPVLPKPPH